MRILNRPMFKYGGPINEGVMHGMRSNYAGGQRVGAFNVGSPVKGMFPKDVTGREHHVAPAIWAGAAGLARLAPTLYRAITGAKNVSKGANLLKNVGGAGSGAGWSTIPRSTVGKEIITIPQAATKASKLKDWAKGWWGGDPTVKSAKWGWKTLTSPGAKTLGEKTLKGITSPTGLLTTGSLAYMFWPDGTPKTKKEIAATGGKPGEKWSPGVGGEQYDPSTSPSAMAAAAKAARTAKLEKYLDTMGYDKAKKTAMGDALIDASAIVQDATTEAGSLKKADWGKMINRAIQSTSKRLDKPEQIREAVGLMLTKSEIEKDLEDPQTKELRRLQIAGAEKALAGETLQESINASFQKSGKFPTGATLAGVARTKGIEVTKVLPSTDIPDDMSAIDYITIITENAKKDGNPMPKGHYVIKDRLVEIDVNGDIIKQVI